MMIAVIAVSQPDTNCVIYNLTAAQAEEFLAETRYILRASSLFLANHL